MTPDQIRSGGGWLRRWGFRTRGFYFAALVVLFPLALWTETREDIASAWKLHAFKPMEVSPGAAVSYAGLQWQLLSFEERPNPKAADQREIIVRLQVLSPTQSATEEALPMKMIRCRPYLEDASGQRWSPVPARYKDISCFRVTRENPVMSERFIVPNARASEVQLAIIMPDERPRYLRFQRPPR